MKKPVNYRSISVKKLAAIISSELSNKSIDVVLTGGACVTIYTTNEYQSMDLDFVARGVEYQKKAIKEAMGGLGFKLSTHHYFSRPDCPFIIEFLPPPLSIGSEPVKSLTTIRSGTGKLVLLSPTECVKDRLAAYYFWNDEQSLKQAKMVAKKHKVDFRELKRWSKVEDQMDKFLEFLDQLGKSKK